jgi:glucokinase
VHSVGDRLIGVDVGGTKVSVAVLEDGVLSEPVVRPTVLTDSGALVDQLAEAIEDAGPADAVGIGVPSVIDFASGRIRYSVNIPLADVPLRDLLTDRVGLPVFVENDASCAALSEAYQGEKLVTSDLVLYTVGTGVGGGLVIGGRLYRGATGAAAEMGHQIIGLDLSGEDVPAAQEKFPQPGSLETLARGGALDALARDQGFPDGKAAVEAAQGGDADAVRIIRTIGERLGIGIANAINIFDPDVVAIGGGVSSAGDLLLDPAERVARRFTLPGVGERTEVRLSRHGTRGGVLGAALLAMLETNRTEEGRDG